MTNEEVRILSPMATISSNQNYVTVLSIPDEFTSQSFNGTTSMYHSNMRASCSKTPNDEIVEVNTARGPPRNGLHVKASPRQRRIEFDDSAKSRSKSYHERIPNSDGSNRLRRDRVHKSGYFGGLPDDLIDDQDDVPLEAAELNVRAQKIVLGKETFGVSTGISVTGVPDRNNPDKLCAVEIIRIEDGRRVALDDQLRIGDRIIKINNRPIYQMSITTARLYLDELKREEEPSIVFYRLPTANGGLKKDPSLQFNKPVTVLVQQGNTAALHNLKDIPITKSAEGFGFRFASRRSERGNIFLITHVIPDGPSDELLLSGDRLIKIGDVDLSKKEQFEVTELIKGCEIGETLVFQVSRNVEEEEANNSSAIILAQPDDIIGLEDDDQIMELRVPVNKAATAGLGLVLKGKSAVESGDDQGAAVFVDRILRGSAAYKDGRLREGDRILGIENLNLLQFTRNSEAAQAFNNYISSLPASCAYFRIFIARKKNDDVELDAIDRKDFLVWLAEADGTVDKLSLIGSRKNSNAQEEVAPQADDAASIVSSQQVDPFNRESATRKSFSEKGPSHMRIDPTQFENFKRINHQRQISAPIISHRKHRAQFRRQRSAIILKNATNASTPSTLPDPTKQKGFSFLSFFGLRNKENVQLESNGQTPSSKRRSTSGAPAKNENHLRTSSSNHENVAEAPLAPSRETLQKKRRSVGTSVFKFFQKTDSPLSSPKLYHHHNADEREDCKLLAEQIASSITINEHPSPTRPLSAYHHKRFHSAHEGFKHDRKWSPTTAQRHFPPRHGDPSTRGAIYPTSHYFDDYYNAFNQWFTSATSTPSAPPEYRHTNAHHSAQNSPLVTPRFAPPYFEQRYHPASVFYPIPLQYSASATGIAPTTQQIFPYFSGTTPPYSMECPYTSAPRRVASTRSAKPSKPHNVYVERF